MTDNDIIKALECCADTTKECEDCPFLQFECIVDTENSLVKSALDLINRQQAEIERLTNIKADELEGKGNKCFDAGYVYGITEFINKFEKKIKDVRFTIGQTWEIQCALKQTLKELTEGSK